MTQNTGRPRGSRNLLTRKFIGALVEEFEAHGAEALKIVRIEQPDVFLKLCASVIPREIDVTSSVASLDDVELDSMIEAMRVRLLEQAAPPMIEARPVEVSDVEH